MSNWPKYESHKVVQAAKITNQERDAQGVVVRVEVVLPDGLKEWFMATVPDMTARAEIGGYAVIYEDGFKSISPAKAFEDGYTRMRPEAAELGAAVRRAGLAGP